MKHTHFLLALLILSTAFIFSQEKKTLDDYKKLGRDSIIGCAKHELMWRHKRLGLSPGLNMNGYSRIEVLAGIENGREVLYVNFDNPIRIREVMNPDRIGIELIKGESYFSSRSDMETFYCNMESTQLQDFLTCLSNAQTGGSLIALPGVTSPTSSYVDVADYYDHYTFTVVSGELEIDYRLKKGSCILRETSRKATDISLVQKPYLEEIK